MNKYEFIDSFSMSIASLFTGKKRYFSKDINSKKIYELLNLIKIEMPKIDGEGYYTVNINYEEINEEAAFRVEQWKGYNYPTIIYHHGAAEGSYDFSFNRILANEKNNINANLIGIQAIFNHSNKEFMNSIKYLSNYTLMLASSVMIVESITNHIRKNGSSKIIVTGASLGGFVTNLHFTYFNTADYYKPLLAGARLGDAFITSAYSKVTSQNAKQYSKRIREVLNFDIDLRKKDQSNIFPLLSKYDQIVMYDLHSKDFEPNQITTIPFGHSTGAIKYKLLRQHILNGI